MRTLKLIEHVSLDGVMQTTNDGDGFPYHDWTARYRTPAGRDMVLAAHGDRFDLVLGRRTYDAWSGFWPTVQGNPMGDRINAATKYVATHRPESLAWGPAEGIGPDVVEGIRRLKAQAGPTLVLSGSSTLSSIILANGLADDVVLLVYPVVVGTGKRFFAEGSAGQALALVNTQSTPTGIVMCTYRAGEPLAAANVAPST